MFVAVFMYAQGVHNVLKVNGSDFQKCASSNATAAPLTSGSDSIHLAMPGKKWYICSVGEHCNNGMKLVITVSVAEGPSPAPSPGTSAAAGEVSPLRSCVWAIAVIAVYKMMIMA